MLDSIQKALNKTLRIAVGCIMLTLLITVVWQVFSRYVLGDPSSFTDELARFLLIWVALLGAAYVTGLRLHLAIDLIPEHRKTIWLTRFIYLMIMTFATLVLVVGGSTLVGLTLRLEQQSAALQVPLGYVYVILPVSGAVIVLYTLIAMSKPIQPEH